MLVQSIGFPDPSLDQISADSFFYFLLGNGEKYLLGSRVLSLFNKILDFKWKQKKRGTFVKKFLDQFIGM